MITVSVHDEKEIEKLLENFTPMIKSKLNNTSYQEREDLEQEPEDEDLRKSGDAFMPRGAWFLGVYNRISESPLI